MHSEFVVSRDQAQGTDAIICSPLMKRLMQMVERVARSNAAVLIAGETGTGKEFLARAIHQHSLRCSKPWIDINCAALPEHLVESELFGYEKGAFSGADAVKQGLFELADKGTLFLDEIGELEPKLQVKLLRVLDGVPYYRLGGSRKVAVDVRIVAATNQPLEPAVASGKFRRDLYHRLSQFQLRVPPLRERLEEIATLAGYFLHQHRPDMKFSPDALEALEAYSWPGNIRELRNVVTQALMVKDGLEICAVDLPLEIRGASPIADGAPAGPPAADLETLERRAIMEALARSGGRQGLAAEQLGISRRTLSRKLKQYETRPEPELTTPVLGFMSEEQQKRFRAALGFPVSVKTSSGEELATTAANVSIRGIAVTGIPEPLKCGGVLDVRFKLPGSRVMIAAKGRVAWADMLGKAGICFVEIASELQNELKQWVSQRQLEEGWAPVTNA